MSISYEEALATLQSMFGSPWTRETLDAVLRNQKGHMENTVDMVLGHGDKDPQILIDQLNSGINPAENTISVDEEIARQLQQAQQQRQPPPSQQAATSSSAAAATGAAANKKGRGTPTVLPDDFLRIPGSSAAASSFTSAANQMESDEALARMLQDEMFSQQVSRNPDLAHLARATTAGRNAPSARGSGRIGELPAGGRNGVAGGGGAQQPDVMGKVRELGDVARKRLSILAAQFQNARVNAMNNINNNSASGGMGGSSGGASERRGLLGDSEGGTSEQRGLLDNEEGDNNMEMAARTERL